MLGDFVFCRYVCYRFLDLYFWNLVLIYFSFFLGLMLSLTGRFLFVRDLGFIYLGRIYGGVLVLGREGVGFGDGTTKNR